MSGYDFSPLYHASQLAFSPGSTFLATSHADRLIIRSTSNLTIVRTWHLGQPSTSQIPAGKALNIDSVQWSDDGLYILVFLKSSGEALVFALAQEGEGEYGEIATIMGNGVEGLERVEWAKGGREVLGWGEHGLKVIIYSLPTGRTSVIQYPKASTGCHSYSADQRYLAVVERHSGKDCIGIYDTSNEYQLVRHFNLQASDVQTIKWSPCSRYIAVVDNQLSYSLYIHSPAGPLLTHFSHLSPTFSPSTSLLSDSAPNSSSILHEDPGLGIRHIAWAPGGQYLLLMGWDGKVRILEAEGWRCLAVIAIGVGKRLGNDVTIWREPDGWIRDTKGRGIVQFDKMPHTSQLPSSSAMPSPASSSLPSPLLVSPSGRHFVFIPPTNPSILHIYSLLPSPTSLPDIKHKATVVLTRNVRDLEWAGGSKERLAVVCRSANKGTQGEGGAVYIWDEEGWEDETTEEKNETRGGGVMEGVGMPNGAGFNISDLQFSSDGKTLALRSRGEFCLMYDTDDQEIIEKNRNIDEIDKEWETEGLSFVREEDEEED